jgi:hypothetical protein
MSSVLLRYEVQSRRIWIAAFTWNVPHLFSSVKKVLGFNNIRLKVSINNSLTQRHMPEKRNIILCLSEKVKNRDEFYVCRGLEMKSTTPEKELYPHCLGYIVYLITAVDRGRVLLYFIKFWNNIMYIYKHDGDRNVSKHVAVV